MEKGKTYFIVHKNHGFMRKTDGTTAFTYTSDRQDRNPYLLYFEKKSDAEKWIAENL